MWVFVGLSVLALGAFAAYRTRRLTDPSDLGWVTERWLAEHRAHQWDESRR
jgi:hypothetical protein